MIAAVTTAADGLAALKMLEDPSNPPFDLIMVDVYMPRLDGFGLLTKVRSNPAWNEIPVISTSAAARRRGWIGGCVCVCVCLAQLAGLAPVVGLGAAASVTSSHPMSRMRRSSSFGGPLQ